MNTMKTAGLLSLMAAVNLGGASPKNQGYHYNRNAETYLETGLRLGWAMAELLQPKP